MVYCISVIEHIERFEDTVDEIARILKPEGILLLTFDLDLRGDQQLGVREYKRLMARLQSHFILVYPETTPHPADLLHSSNGPYGFKEFQGWRRIRYFLNQEVLRPLLGRPSVPMFPYSLAVMGQVLKKSGRG